MPPNNTSSAKKTISYSTTRDNPFLGGNRVASKLGVLNQSKPSGISDELKHVECGDVMKSKSAPHLVLKTNEIMVIDA